VTVSDHGTGKRRLTPQERARLGAEAWRLKDTQGLSVRTIHKRFVDQGYDVSHMTVWRLLKEAYEQAQFLDLIGPAEMRVGAIGRLEAAMEKLLAAIDTGEIDIDKGTARYVQLETLLIKLTGAAMPSRVQVTDDRESPKPDLAFLEALRKATEEAERQEKEEEANGFA
jgi:hypothetical protein